MSITSTPLSPRELVAQQVRMEMARRQVKQAELAEFLGRNQQALSRRLRGEVPFNADELKLIADFFEVEISRFYAEPQAA